MVENRRVACMGREVVVDLRSISNKMMLKLKIKGKGLNISVLCMHIEYFLVLIFLGLTSSKWFYI
jgi:hypothetical protein